MNLVLSNGLYAFPTPLPNVNVLGMQAKSWLDCYDSVSVYFIDLRPDIWIPYPEIDAGDPLNFWAVSFL